MGEMPGAAEFFEAAAARARKTADFARAISEQGPLTDDQRTWLEVGIGSGITAAVEELQERNLLGGSR